MKSRRARIFFLRRRIFSPLQQRRAHFSSFSYFPPHFMPPPSLFGGFLCRTFSPSWVSFTGEISIFLKAVATVYRETALFGEWSRVMSFNVGMYLFISTSSETFWIPSHFLACAGQIIYGSAQLRARAKLTGVGLIGNPWQRSFGLNVLAENSWVFSLQSLSVTHGSRILPRIWSNVIVPKSGATLARDGNRVAGDRLADWAVKPADFLFQCVCNP